MKRRGIFAALVCAVLVSSCSYYSDDGGRTMSGEASDSGDHILAVVGDHYIKVRDFQEQLNRRARMHRDGYANEEQRRKLLDEMVRRQVLLAQAKNAGFDRKPEIQAQVDEFIIARFQEDRLGRDAMPAVGDEEARQFYQRHLAEFATPAAVRFALIYFKCSSKATDEKRRELKRKAEAVLTRAQTTDAGEFNQLVLQHSDDQSTRYAGGDAGWVQQGAASPRWDATVLKAAFAVSKPGSFTPIVETPNGFYLVRLLEKKPEGVQSFDQVKKSITYELAQRKQFQRQQEFFEEMKRGLKIEIHPEALKFVPPVEQAAESRPPPLPKS